MVAAAEAGLFADAAGGHLGDADHPVLVGVERVEIGEGGGAVLDQSDLLIAVRSSRFIVALTSTRCGVAVARLTEPDAFAMTVIVVRILINCQLTKIRNRCYLSRIASRDSRGRKQWGIS